MDSEIVHEEEIAALREYVKKNFTIWDAHMHLGLDIDTKHMDITSLINLMAAKGIQKAAVFPLDDPRKGESFSRPNDVIRDTCKKFPRKFLPFFRLNPNVRWKEEFSRCHNSGFRGIKLHPRSQNFHVDSKEAMSIYYNAEKSALPVLLHAGKGLENIAKKLLQISRQFPDIVIIAAHSVYMDIDNAIDLLSARKQIYFELSATKPDVILKVMDSIPAERILYGTDSPYIPIDAMLDRTLTAYSQSSLGRADLKNILSANLQKLLRGI